MKKTATIATLEKITTIAERRLAKGTLTQDQAATYADVLWGIADSAPAGERVAARVRELEDVARRWWAYAMAV